MAEIEVTKRLFDAWIVQNASTEVQEWWFAISDNINQLKAVVEKLPKYADGSLAIDGGPAYHPATPNVGHHVCINSDAFVMTGANEYVTVLSECYPTAEAAEAAQATNAQSQEQELKCCFLCGYPVDQCDCRMPVDSED